MLVLWGKILSDAKIRTRDLPTQNSIFLCSSSFPTWFGHFHRFQPVWLRLKQSIIPINQPTSISETLIFAKKCENDKFFPAWLRFDLTDALKNAATALPRENRMEMRWSGLTTTKIRSSPVLARFDAIPGAFLSAVKMHGWLSFTFQRNRV